MGSNKVAFAVLIVVSLVVVAGVVGYVAMMAQASATGLPPLTAEERARLLKEPAEVYAVDADRTSLDKHVEIKQLVARYEAAMSDQRIAADQLYDGDLLTRWLLEQSDRSLDFVERADLVDYFSVELPKQLLQDMREVGLVEVVLDHVRMESTGTEAVVYVTLRYNNDVRERYRWWVSSRNGPWRIYDVSSLYYCSRLRQDMAELLDAGLSDAMRDRITLFTNSVEASFDAPTHEAMEKQLKDLSTSGIPGKYLSRYWYALAVAYRGQSKSAETLAVLDKLEALDADNPCIWMLRAWTFNALKRYEEAVKAANRYVALAGDDAEAYHEIAVAYSWLERFDAAEEAARKGLAKNPGSIDCITDLALFLSDEDMDQLKPFVDKLPKPEVNLLTLAEQLDRHRVYSALKIVVDAMVDRKIGDSSGNYYAAKVALYLDDDHARAAELLEALVKGIALASDDMAKRIRNAYVVAMYRCERSVEAYQRFPDQACYARLARGLAGAAKSEPLDALNKAHAQRHGGDNKLHYYRGEVHHLNERWDEAEKHYLAGLKHLPADDEDETRHWRNAYREALVYNSYKADRALDAYERFGPKEATFRQLMNLIYDDDAIDVADRVVARAREDQLPLPDIDLWEGWVTYHQKAYAKALVALDAYATKTKPEDRWWMYKDLRLRSLLQSGQMDVVEGEIGGLFEDEDADWWRLLARAKSGNVDEAIKHAKACEEAGYRRASFYRDPLLGPILESEDFAAFRTALPPEAESENGDEEDDAQGDDAEGEPVADAP